MGQTHRNDALTQKFKIDFEYLMASRGVRRTMMNKILSLRNEEGDLIFSGVRFDDNGNIMGKTTLETIDWVRNEGVEVQANQEYIFEGSSGLDNLMRWLDAGELGIGRRGLDTAYLRLNRKYNIIYFGDNGELINTWETGDETWSFGLTGQFSINPPDTPNKLYQSLEYKITGLISNYLVLKPINYPNGLYIKLPSQEE